MEDIRDVEDTRRQNGGVKRASTWTLRVPLCALVRALCNSTVCACQQYYV
jgi:hypothetical protein